ncbi:MFS transporter [Psittacicella gerlachiana]|uniref:Uncharacterized protein n=1 Tax=Psittacicella gerlachiana TaxID=2028574 RepID=A0A3A1YMM7_9GAMM|nr:MFS transporter [Psittacicella gerlachiana]RIY38925.1 hypothetical protein CKF59_00045 [Psittacicella gerlachiana]
MNKSPLCTKVSDFIKNNRQLLLGFSLFTLVFFKLYLPVFFLPIVYFHLLNKLNPQYNPTTNEHRQYYWSFLVVSFIQLIIVAIGISLALLIADFAGFVGVILALIIGYITSYVLINTQTAYVYLFLNDVTILQALTESRELYNKLPAKDKKRQLTFFSFGFFALGLLSLFCLNALFIFLASFLLFALVSFTAFLSQAKPQDLEQEDNNTSSCNCKENVADLFEKALDPQTYVNLLFWVVKVIFDTIAGIFQTIYAVYGDFKEAFVYTEDKVESTNNEKETSATSEEKSNSEEKATAEENLNLTQENKKEKVVEEGKVEANESTNNDLTSPQTEASEEAQTSSEKQTSEETQVQASLEEQPSPEDKTSEDTTVAKADEQSSEVAQANQEQTQENQDTLNEYVAPFVPEQQDKEQK